MIYEHLWVSVFVGGAVGFVMCFAANGFVQAVLQITHLRESLDLVFKGNVSGVFSPVALISLFFAALILALIRQKLGLPRWFGPADTIYTAHRTDNELDIKAGLGSTFAAMISAGSGASVGQYGPIVHFGATLGSAVRHFLSVKLSTDVFIGCGVAAGIASAFGAPIAGIIFAHEAVLRHFSLRAIVPISIASVSSVWFSDYFFEASHIFDFEAVEFDLAALAPIALLCGPLFGVVAIILMSLTRFLSLKAAASSLSSTKLCLLAALIVGVAGGFVPEILGLGTEVVKKVLSLEYAVPFLILLCLLKILATALCLSFGLFGGIFSPALFIGATTGALVGQVLAPVFGVTMAVAVSVSGMAAVGSAVIGAPMAGVLIVLELTGSYQLALCVMLSVMSCILVTNLIFGHSYFDRQLLDRGVDITKGRGQIEMTETPVISVMSQAYTRLGSSATNTQIAAKLIEDGVTEAYVISPRGILLGKVSLVEVTKNLVDGSELVIFDRNPLQIKHDASLQQAIEVASEFVGESIPIVDTKSQQMIGVVNESDLFRLYLSLQTKVADLERS